MAAATVRYQSVEALWKEIPQPPITKEQAKKAAKAIYRKFGSKNGFPRQKYDAKLFMVRQCWASSRPSRLNKGWRRLVHDVSHLIFRKRYPQFKPHHPLHARLELEIAEYAAHLISCGYVEPKPRKHKDQEALRAKKLTNVDAALKRWDSKLRRAQNAIKKLATQRKRLAHAASANHSPAIGSLFNASAS